MSRKRIVVRVAGFAVWLAAVVCSVLLTDSWLSAVGLIAICGVVINSVDWLLLRSESAPAGAGVGTRRAYAWVMMRQGLPKVSLAYALATDKRAKKLRAEGLYALNAVDLAVYCALLGDVAEAERWLAAAETRDGARVPKVFPAYKVLARALLDCRTGFTAEAVRLLDDRWSECETRLGADAAELRLLRVIRGFAVAATTPDDVERVTAILEPARAPRVGPVLKGDEYACLANAWPEMKAFLARVALK